MANMEIDEDFIELMVNISEDYSKMYSPLLYDWDKVNGWCVKFKWRN